MQAKTQNFNLSRNSRKACTRCSKCQYVLTSHVSNCQSCKSDFLIFQNYKLQTGKWFKCTQLFWIYTNEKRCQNDDESSSFPTCMNQHCDYFPSVPKFTRVPNVWVFWMIQTVFFTSGKLCSQMWMCFQKCQCLPNVKCQSCPKCQAFETCFV